MSTYSDDVAGAANRRIWEFVHERRNRKLRPGTGWYSTPFRGGLFGAVKAAEVARLLATRNVDVFWLGANPCVRSSLDNVLSPSTADGDFPTFQKQIESGFFGSWKWSNDKAEPDWNPIDAPRAGWQLYRDLLQQIGSLECVAMANLIPWGSHNAKTFLTRLGSAEPSLLRRVVEFADDLNAHLVQALAPRLVVVPLSLARSSSLDAVMPIGLSLHQASEITPRVVRTAEGPFNFYTAICQRGRLAVRTVFVRHPASLRLSKESKKRIVGEVAQVLRTFQDS